MPPKYPVIKPKKILKHDEFAKLTALFEDIFDDRFINSCLSKLYTEFRLNEDTYYPVDIELYSKQSKLPLYKAYAEVKELVYKYRTMSYELTLDDSSVINIPLLHNFHYCDITKTLEVQWTKDVIPFISGDMPAGKFSYYYRDYSEVSSHTVYTLLEFIQRNWYLLNFNKPIVVATNEVRRLTGTLDTYQEFAELNRRVIKPALQKVLELKGVELSCKGNKHAVSITRKKAIPVTKDTLEVSNAN
jgi:plasmid replication initiation protein